MYIRSPLNYIGGKYKLLKALLPSFTPANNFVDLFAGGMNVAINVDYPNIYVNDRIDYLIELYGYIKETPTNELLQAIHSLIEQYHLTEDNHQGYIELRDNYNWSKSPLKLFVLTCYSYNNQIRFNNSFEFNTSFGKGRSSFNPKMEQNLILFSETLKKKNIILSNLDFRSFDFDQIDNDCLVYCDPPYLITTGSYNDGTRGFGNWLKSDDLDLLQLLDNLNASGKKFALSNVTIHKGESNDHLIHWAEKYYTTSLDMDYSSCSYNVKDRIGETAEVLITNYPVKPVKLEPKKFFVI